MYELYINDIFQGVYSEKYCLWLIDDLTVVNISEGVTVGGQSSITVWDNDGPDELLDVSYRFIKEN